MSYRKLIQAGLFTSALALAVLPGCIVENGRGGGGSDDEITNEDGDAPLSDHDSLFDGWPTNDKLADEGKADAIYPKQFTDLVAFQSPVRSQGRRGVCSIFSTVGLMEHLYIKEGTITQPDFSEQFLQWSVKTELGRFPNTDGSSANYNLEALNRKGVVVEADWPYQASGWNESNDPECTGDDKPTKCYTNGAPPEAALQAQRWHLPRGRWVSTRPNSIKAHMTNKKEAVVVGGTFFYQSWNHRTSTLKTNNEYWRKGFVTYPNAEDRKISLEKRAGHSILLVGWDDELEVQQRDSEGNLVEDANGDPVMDKGFWLFKNSWGTGSFGVENPHGDGYGWISMKYIQEDFTAYVSGEPDVDVTEICGNNKDDDFDGDSDCEDSDCANEAACAGGTNIYTNDMGQDIPDATPAGIESVIEVAEGGTIASLSVSVDITHPYQGDLIVKLMRDGGGEVVLHDLQGSGEDNLKQSYVVGDFNGEDAAGTWRLVVSDNAEFDTGRLNGWSLEIATGSGGGTSDTYESSEQVAIPDNDPVGVFTNISVPDEGAISALKVRVTIDHPYQGDLTVKLQRVGEPGEVVLQQADASSGPFDTKNFVVSDFNGTDAAGTWRLIVADEASSDEGSLEGWGLEITK